jgi:HAMP domain-containing protein
MTTFTLKITATDATGLSRVVLSATLQEPARRELTVTAASLETDDVGTPSADAITALRCLPYMEVMAATATGLKVNDPQDEIAALKANVKRLTAQLESLTTATL